MDRYCLRDFEKVSDGTLIGATSPDESCDKFELLLTDSRLLTDPENTAFFAINGTNHNGSDFMETLYQRGVRNFVIPRDSSPPDVSLTRSFPEAIFLKVKDPVSALQQFSRKKRESYDIPVVGITGSNGKTIVKEWLYQLLHRDLEICRSPKSYNSQIGVPLSVWQLDPDSDLGIFEAGISRPGEMKSHQPVIQPTVGIFTNISDAHQENFNTYRQKINEKLNLFTETEQILYCRDKQEIRLLLEDDPRFSKKQLISWSTEIPATLRINQIHRQNGHTDISASFLDRPVKIRIPFSDEASIENSIHCLLYLLHSGYGSKAVLERFEQLTPIAMRLELKEGKRNCLIINDSYNSDLMSLTIALDFLSNQKKHTQKTVILSDIQQSTVQAPVLYKNIADMINSRQIDRFIGIGQSIEKFRDLFRTSSSFFPSTRDFIRSGHLESYHNEVILLKGARSFHFEYISDMLQQKIHDTVLEIDLKALISNYNHFRGLLHKKTRMMVMVKAFSYGSGLYEIANQLQIFGADYLAVAYTDEGIELRNAGIQLPIMIMNPKIEQADLLLAYRLEPEIYSLKAMDHFLNTMEKTDIHASPYPVHLKFDTGMNRLGFHKNDLEPLIEMLKSSNRIQIKSIFSHLAASEDPALDPFTMRQFKIFQSICERLEEQFDYPIIKHILNSAGIERFPDFQYDMVRLGIGLYGFSAIEAKELTGVTRLKSIISQIKEIRKGETIGYGRMGKLKEGSRIAIVPIGYADGLNRRLGNGIGQMYVNEIPVPIIGNISMDMCAIDISGLDVSEGDMISVYSDNSQITKLANDLQTIPYEILTGISQRVKRIYYQ